jgi:hypothetical protein
MSDRFGAVVGPGRGGAAPAATAPTPNHYDAAPGSEPAFPFDDVHEFMSRAVADKLTVGDLVHEVAELYAIDVTAGSSPAGHGVVVPEDLGDGVHEPSAWHRLRSAPAGQLWSRLSASRSSAASSTALM